MRRRSRIPRDATGCVALIQLSSSASYGGPVEVGVPELLVVFVVVILLFGADRLPKLARSLGRAQREFRAGLSDRSDDAAPREPPTADEPPAR